MLSAAARLGAAPLLCLVWVGFQGGGLAEADEPTPRQIFEQRLLPIFKSPNPSSCIECHFSNVELKQYILPSHEQTFVSLRDQGLIDLEKPENSRILKFIRMGEAAEQAGGRSLIPAKVRQAEYEAFAAWIKASVGDAKLRDAPKLKASELAGPKRPVEVIRHGRQDRLLDAFEDTIWAERHRCMSCHVSGSPENRKFVAEFGEEISWVKEDAPSTLRFLIASKLIDRKKPEQSLLLTKPLGVVEHKGGKKFLPGDQGYKAFRGWIEDYVKIVEDKYPTARSLPPVDASRERFASEIWLKLTSTSPAWGERLLQADVYAWDAAKQAWEPVPIATSDRLVNAKNRLWQHTLTLAAEQGSPRAVQWSRGPAALPAGKYLIKLYVDQQGKLQRDWQAPLGAGEYVGSIEVDSPWGKGYGAMTAVDTSKLKP